MNPELIKEYTELLNTEDIDENVLQKYLECNTQLIPLPILENHNLSMNVIISKLKIGNEFVTDFAYLTKSSIQWKIVLIELENPRKHYFKKSDDNIEFTAEFNNAIDQISSWKVYLHDNKQQLLRQVEKLRKPLEDNPTDIEYVLVYGRSNELANSEKRRKMLMQKQKDSSIYIMTYDSLISRYTSFSMVDREKVILSSWGEQGYQIKFLPNGSIDTSIFGYVPSDYLKINGDQRKRLLEDGFEIDEWEKGYSLYINERKATSSLINYKVPFRT